jgi:hypothetical protein
MNLMLLAYDFVLTFRRHGFRRSWCAKASSVLGAPTPCPGRVLPDTQHSHALAARHPEAQAAHPGMRSSIAHLCRLAHGRMYPCHQLFQSKINAAAVVKRLAPSWAAVAALQLAEPKKQEQKVRTHCLDVWFRCVEC